MPDFGIFRGFNDKLFGDKLYAGQLPTQLGLIGSISFAFKNILWNNQKKFWNNINDNWN